jgi:hypothetical protein
MSCENVNFGIANPKVEILEKLPHVLDAKKTYNFDISAMSFETMSDSRNGFFDPLFVEFIRNNDKTFGACFPSRRKYYCDNLLASSISSSEVDEEEVKETIKWTPISLPVSLNEKNFTYFSLNVIKNFPSYYVDMPLDNPLSRTPKNIKSDDYVGPIWRNTNYNEEARPDDSLMIQKFRDLLEGVPLSASPSSTSENTPTDGDFDSPIIKEETSQKKPVVSRSSILQTESRDGLWWGVESSAFIIEENMAFGVTIEIPAEPPPDYEYPTTFSIHFGNKKNEFEIFMKLGQKPQIIDYYGIAGGHSGDDNKIEMGANLHLQSGEFGVGKSEFKGRIDVSFMICSGRLVVFVNNNHYVYTRTEKDPKIKDDIGEMREIKINIGGIKVYGTNSIANVYAYPLSFAKQAFMCFGNIPVETRDGNNIGYSAVGEDGNPNGKPVALLPSADTLEPLYGVDCEKFYDESPSGSITIQKSFGVQAKSGTTIEFYPVSSFFSKFNIKSKFELTDYYVLIMTCSDTEEWLGGSIQHGRNPFFFKLKGVYAEQDDLSGAEEPIDVTDDIISISCKSSAPDFTYVSKNANFKLYNKDGKYNYLGLKQRGVRISWGWKSNSSKQTVTFTGVIVDLSFTNTPGKEVIDVTCEDYFHIIENVPIINSPIYDGMLGIGVLKDLSERGGLEAPIVSEKWLNTRQYFLPSGYAFTSPVMRFPSEQMIKECMIDIAKRFEAYMYFDADGRLIIEKVPGGIAGYNTTDPDQLRVDIGSKKFTSIPNPEVDSDGNTPYTILDEKSVSLSYRSTSNTISVLSVDRNTRAHILYATSASGPSGLGILSFRKVSLLDEAALGGVDSVEAYANELSERLFYATRKVSIRTAGSDTIMQPLSYISVDGRPYRLISINTSYDANSNSITSEYEAEW